MDLSKGLKVSLYGKVKGTVDTTLRSIRTYYTESCQNKWVHSSPIPVVGENRQDALSPLVQANIQDL